MLHHNNFIASFLNKATFRKSTNTTKYLEAKLEKLLLVLEIIMNVQNRKYIGPLNEANRHELILGYKSAETTFGLASRSGITMSLSRAEKALAKKAKCGKLWEVFISRIQSQKTADRTQMLGW